ncbi:hypothetical protein BX616_002800 [Lobosporangium transversale]|nr:hypothetical protein BX616_002800 [Lobosporangium transversale]
MEFQKYFYRLDNSSPGFIEFNETVFEMSVCYRAPGHSPFATHDRDKGMEKRFLALHWRLLFLGITCPFPVFLGDPHGIDSWCRREQCPIQVSNEIQLA